MADAIKAADPFTASVPAGKDSVSTRFYIDGAPAGESPVKDGISELGFPEGLPKGSYTFTATGVNAEGEGPASEAAVLVIAGVLPSAPGTITFRFGAA